jgi:hypothetical protein
MLSVIFPVQVCSAANVVIAVKRSNGHIPKKDFISLYLVLAQARPVPVVIRAGAREPMSS